MSLHFGLGEVRKIKAAKSLAAIRVVISLFLACTSAMRLRLQRTATYTATSNITGIPMEQHRIIASDSLQIQQ